MLRKILWVKYRILERHYNRLGRADQIKAELPTSLLDRLYSLVSRDKACLLWGFRATYAVTKDMRNCLKVLHDYLAVPANPWSTPIAFIIDREPHIETLGDASHDAGGAYCPVLHFWFDIQWSPELRRRIKLKPSDPDLLPRLQQKPKGHHGIPFRGFSHHIPPWASLQCSGNLISVPRD